MGPWITGTGHKLTNFVEDNLRRIFHVINCVKGFKNAISSHGHILASDVKKRCIRHRNFSNWRWHLDEVFVKVGGERRYLWRAVDHEGTILDAVVTKRRDKKAVYKLLKRLMKEYGRPVQVVTDRLASYKAALRQLAAGRWENN